MKNNWKRFLAEVTAANCILLPPCARAQATKVSGAKLQKFLPQTLVISLLLGLLGAVASAQDGRERVRFTPGSNSVALTRTLSADTGVITFIANANRGQTMTFSVDGAKDIDVSLSVPKAHDPELQSGTGKSNTYQVVKTGEHYITVVNRTGKKAQITFRLKILPNGVKAPQRIDWVKDGRSLVWEAAVPAKSSKEYVFYAHKGQKLSLSFVDDTGVGSMDLGKYSVEPNTDPMKMTIGVSKDYTFTVLNNSNKATSFRIGFNLEGSAQPPSSKPTASDAERIGFPKGSIEVNLEKTAPANGAKRFVFGAKVGQEIAFTITPKIQNAKLVIDFNGKKVGLGKLFSMIAPKTADYSLQVTNFDNASRGFYFDLGIATPEKTATAPITRIRLAKGEQVADLKGTLGAKQSKKYMAYVVKGNMITIVPQDNVGSNIRVRLDGKEFDFRDSTSTEHQSQSKDHLIEIYNTANAPSPFHFWIGFSEHG